MVDCRVVGNVAYEDGSGGVFTEDTDLTLRRCELSGNRGWDGVGVLVYGGTTRIDSCRVVHNLSHTFGGGIQLQSGKAVITRTLIANNISENGVGGGLCRWGGDVELEHVTITGNESLFNESDQIFFFDTWGHFFIRNSIIWGAVAFDSETNGPRLYLTVNHSLVMADTLASRGVGNLVVAPMFVDSAGGDYRLTEGSPAVDAGDPSMPPDPDGPLPDIGAFASPFGKIKTIAAGSRRPAPLALHQNRPNPFNPSTTIRFTTPASGVVNVTIWTVHGQLIRTLVNGPFAPGVHEVVWDGRDEHGRTAASGVYLYRLAGKEGVLTRRMTLLR
jgi:hypothetical protein